MSRKERVVAAIRHVIATGAPARRGLAERLLAGVLLTVAVVGAVLIPRLLVGPSPQHELGVGAPSMTGPPVVLAPGLPAQKSHAPAAANPRIHATHVSVVPSAGASQPTAQGRPEPNPATRRPPAAQSPPPAQPEPDSQSQATIRALTPTPLATAPPQTAPEPPTPPHPHPVPKPKVPKLAKPHHEPKLPKSHDEPKLPEPPTPPKSHEHPKPHPEHPEPHPEHPKSHPDHAKPEQTPPPTPSPEAEPHGNANGHKP